MLTTISIDRGLLTMDLRFGDVIDDAARYFKDAYNRSYNGHTTEIPFSGVGFIITRAVGLFLESTTVTPIVWL
ncbi:putative ATP citrate synthase [Helianthus annuus]|uniref:ATP citrate synthase n=1 Tax=Helianthus annuus TaxID=4232 RepID=A0A251VP34_HELAN|nr:putative ATP citrate synthase [Helianthus annuus]KAJ0611393.1 putative ATP citrate synthase [Helianthus annuus]KAJ0622433.1 putative ATP citrate synthase [Helianthus annuus]KAJ0626692.1 putative ATP citrate synthase [Helianthus annuus]KAJ0699158.1 putative ATP citrate synthase [Helianthus annuus]